MPLVVEDHTKPFAPASSSEALGWFSWWLGIPLLLSLQAAPWRALYPLPFPGTRLTLHLQKWLQAPLGLVFRDWSAKKKNHTGLFFSFFQHSKLLRSLYFFKFFFFFYLKGNVLWR